MLNTPVLLLVFNRPDTTAKVFEAVRWAKPKQLFIAADGPRAHKPEDVVKCQQVRKITTQIDWECEIKTLFRDQNLGCGRGPANAITWFFEQVDRGIILEDDCLPGEDFFRFCQELLSYYRDYPKVMHIHGTNLSAGNVSTDKYYFFSNYCNPAWGWATWRRAWQNFKFEFQDLEGFIKSGALTQTLGDKNQVRVWIDFFKEHVQDHRSDIWDNQWQYTVWRNSGIAVVPGVNLVENIGCGTDDATHTTGQDPIIRGLKREMLDSTKTRPEDFTINTEADLFVFENFYRKWQRHFSIKQFIHDRLYKFLPDYIKTYYRSLKVITRGS